MRHSRLVLLTDARFVVAVLVLLVNDAALKLLWPGWITGKLSDIAGLFAWTFFWSVVLPRRLSVLVAVATGTGFIYWKSSAADGVIAWWNSAVPVQVGRVVDLTDLLALAVLPLAVILVHRARPISTSRFLRASMALGSIFAFAATSNIYPVTVWPENLEFEVPRPRAEVLGELIRRGHFTEDPGSILSQSPAKPLDFRLRETPCEFRGMIVVAERSSRTVLTVREVRGMESCMGYEKSRPGIVTEIRDYLIRPLENWLLATDNPDPALDPAFRQVLGCYSIHIGGFRPSMRFRQRWIPGELELVDSLGWWELEGYRGRRMVLPDRDDRSLWWEPIGLDSFRIAGVRHSSRFGIEIRLPRAIVEPVETKATSFGDDSEPTFEAPAVVRRVQCSQSAQ